MSYAGSYSYSYAGSYSYSCPGEYQSRLLGDRRDAAKFDRPPDERAAPPPAARADGAPEPGWDRPLNPRQVARIRKRRRDLDVLRSVGPLPAWLDPREGRRRVAKPKAESRQRHAGSRPRKGRLHDPGAARRRGLRPGPRHGPLVQARPRRYDHPPLLVGVFIRGPKTTTLSLVTCDARRAVVILSRRADASCASRKCNMQGNFVLGG